MGSISFEEFRISECQNENCGQRFNEYSIKLAVWLYGAIFLVQREKFDNTDPYGPSKLILSAKDIKGYVGITCPKCLETNFFSKTVEDIRMLQTFLASGLTLDQKPIKSADGNYLKIQETFPLNLRYYSPFGLKKDLLNNHDIVGSTFTPADEDYFYDEITIFVAGEGEDLEGHFCSFSQHSLNKESLPIGEEAYIYWYNNKDIPIILNLEKDKEERIFPRYHYFPELLLKADALLKYNYHSDKIRFEAKNEHKMIMEQYYEQETDHEENSLTQPPTFKELLERKKAEITGDPKMNAEFLEFLFLEPIPIVNFFGKSLKNCDYLWVEKNPFYEKGLPDDFIFEQPYLGFLERANKNSHKHQKLLKLIRENMDKQYVQEFLKKNLIDFLEEYEEQLSSNQFSYASIWELKESYLEGLFKATNKGLSSEAPYVMSREGEDTWRIVFNNKKSEKLLTGVGFAYIYYLLCNENEYYYHSDLLLEGKGVESKVHKKEPKKKYGVYRQDDGNDQFNDDASSDTKPQPAISRKDLAILFSNIKKCEDGLSDAEILGNKEKILKFENELESLKKYKNEVYNPKTKGPRFIQDDKNRKAVNSVGRALKRALVQLQKKHPEAYKYLHKALDGDHLYRETLSYNPAPEDKVDWILS